MVQDLEVEMLLLTEISWKNINEKIKGWGSALIKLIWPLTLLSLIVFFSFFFVSYSLARHKRLVGQLRSQVLRLEAEAKVEKAEKKKIEARLALALLKKKDKESEEKRKKIRNSLSKLERDRKKAYEDLVKKRKELKSDNRDDLMKKAEQILKETF